ncbi:MULTISPECIES: hypothetical protein [unclassified Massilia]|uniref:bpX5 domain-containing protein n=1 Tax=unclassified Massilia TaxID=2609279 RepID=UPI001785BDBE|nr:MULTISPECIES: hypothetical protein [unclassified Massilia]MBD8528862.1 hypothetical protein [Massilia sp. CFBP 13647]MBD8673504.1 hypothetical protein [Massilia sp. CFBP 13721]
MNTGVLAWRARTDRPAPAGLVAAGPALGALLRELGRREADSLRRLQLAATRDLLVVLGPAERLPWVDGVRYCAPLAGVPGLWLPTTLAPDAPAAPAELLHAALQRRTGHAAMLLWTAPDLVLGLDNALPARPAVLDWLTRECT